MPFTAKETSIIAAEAAKFGLQADVLSAIVYKESNGRFFWEANKPMIRIEGHYFYRLLTNKEERALAVRQGLAASRAGVIPNPNSQAARYDMVRRMTYINHDAAMKSISMGAGQIMGEHYHRLGYGRPIEMWNDAHSMIGQIHQMAAFIASDPQLKKAVNSKDWKTIARLYNGPGYRVNKYDTELERIYKAQAARAASRFMGAAVPDMPLPPAQERLYALGKNVVAFQEQRGLKVDGIFGKITEAEFLKYEQELREAKPRAPAMAVATAGTTGLGLFGTIAAQTQTVQDTLTPITSSLQGITVNADKVIAIVTASLVLAAIGVAIYKWARS